MMLNLIRFVGILFIECSAALIAGRNPRKLVQRINALFNISPIEHTDLTDLEKSYAFLFIVHMASGNPKISPQQIAEYIHMRKEELDAILWNSMSNGLLAYEDNTSGILAHFSELRSIYIHESEKHEEVVKGIYKMLEHIYFLSNHNPAMTFISLKGDGEFRKSVLEGA